MRPTKQPTKKPTKQPTKQPTKTPTKKPTKQPTKSPTNQPTKSPTKQPTKAPTKKPTSVPIPAAAEIVITELFFFYEETWHYLEIYNAGNTQVDLSMYTVGSLYRNHTITGRAVLPPKKYWALGFQNKTEGNAILNYVLTPKSPLGGRTTIYDPFNRVIDRVDFNHGTDGWPLIKSINNARASLSLKGRHPELVDNNDPSRWCVSQNPWPDSVLGDKGTPGMANDCSCFAVTKACQHDSDCCSNYCHESMAAKFCASAPTQAPTKRPTKQPTKTPTKKPTKQPTKKPTKQPTKTPTKKPTKQPTKKPTTQPTKTPTKKPTKQPTKTPTKKPTKAPTKKPTKQPTKTPTKKPTKAPTKKPTKAPTKAPTKKPTKQPTKTPTKKPTMQPTKAPTRKPTIAPVRTPPRLLITEIMIDPSLAGVDTSHEWIEIYNAGTSTVDLKNFYIETSTQSHRITSTLIMNPGNYFVLGNSTWAYNGVPVFYVYSGITFEGSNVNRVSIRDPDKNLIDSVEFTLANGFTVTTGASLALRSNAYDTIDNNDGINWCTSQLRWGVESPDRGTPAAANGCPLANLVISEFMMDPSGDNALGEWIELYSFGSFVANLKGYILEIGSTSHTIASSLIVGVGKYVVVGVNDIFATNGNVNVAYKYSGLSAIAVGSSITVKRPNGDEIDRVDITGLYPSSTGVSTALKPGFLIGNNNQAKAWCTSSTMWVSGGDMGTPGLENDCPCAVVSETCAKNSDCCSNYCHGSIAKFCTSAPTQVPTKRPTKQPTKKPTKAPTKKPTKVPTKKPTKQPTNSPVNILPKLLITEIMIDANLANPDTTHEWVEIYNAGSSTVDLKNFFINTAFETHQITSTVSVAPGAYVVLADSTNQQSNGGVPADYAYDTIVLGVGGDNLVYLTDSQGNLIDSVDVTATYNFATVPTGASLALRNNAFDDTDNDNGINWCVSPNVWPGATNGDKGTPGKANDCP